MKPLRLEAIETELGVGRKQIVISSELYYEDILSYSYINNVPKDAIKLYWYVNQEDYERYFKQDNYSVTEYSSSYKVDITNNPLFNTAFIDLDNNDLIDLIEWNTPHTSNQKFEISIEILNIQSYPTLFSNWTVQFITKGTGNLTISAINGTTFTELYNDNSTTNDDIKIQELRCGNDTLLNKDAQINNENISFILFNGSKVKLSDTLNQSIRIKSIYAENFNCNNKTAKQIVRVITTGVHIQEFNFSNSIKYAYNFVGSTISINATSPILYDYVNVSCNVSDDTGLSHIRFFNSMCQCNTTLFALTGTSSSYHNITIINSTPTTNVEFRCYVNNTAGVWNYSTINVTVSTNLSNCSNLDVANIEVDLIRGVSSAGSCFTVLANNITLDCNGYLINYSNSVSGYAFNNSRYNYSTIKNCIITQGSAQSSAHAIVLFKNSTYNVVFNNTMTTSASNGIGIVISVYNKARAEEELRIVESLFNNLPECQWMRESLIEARKSFEKKDFDKTISLVKVAMERCKRLIPEIRRIEIPSPISTLKLWIVYIGVLAVTLILIYLVPKATKILEKNKEIDEVSVILQKINKARDKLLSIDLESAKWIYLEILRMYNLLPPEKKWRVYKEVKKLYDDRKSAELR